MIKNQFPSGNYPASEENTKRDILVHWCHGAPGIALTLVKAAEVFGDREFVEAAAAAADVVWNRGLLKRVGICHGISGNAYFFLSLYRATGRCELPARYLSICTMQKPLLASCSIKGPSYSKKGKCMEVIVLIPCLKALQAWPTCSLTWSTHLRPGSQVMSFKLLDG